MSKRLVVLIIFAVLAMAVSVGVVYYLTHRAAPAPKPKQAQGIEEFTPPAEKHPRTTACSLMDAKLAAKIIGGDAARNDKVTAIQTKDYTSSVCEYINGGKKATVVLYVFASESSAAAGKAKVQTQTSTFDPITKTISTTPQQSAAGSKGKSVVTAVVSSGAAYDAASSQQLIDEVMKKL